MESLLAKYLKNPCGVLSIPYWKSLVIRIPEEIKIAHANVYNEIDYHNMNIQRFFRISHNLENLNYCKNQCVDIDLQKDEINLVKMMIESYKSQNIRISCEDLHIWKSRKVYNEDLWICIKKDNKIIASGIAEFDKEIKEGILEWVQVIPDYQHMGFGKMIVLELLKRLKALGAHFVTVSGSIDNMSNPEMLYRSCGFTGNDIWYICSKAVK